jgi:choline dehydrogenase-like flavoprotein
MAKHDVVVVGSGAGGGAVAYGLAAKGAKVLLLEIGKRYDPYNDSPMGDYDFEVQGFPEDKSLSKHSFGPAQKLTEKLADLRSWYRVVGRLNRTDRRAYTAYHHVKGVGGSTLHFQGEAHRLHPNAFKMRSRWGVGNDWPISYDDLAPYYDQAEDLIGVAGPASHPFKPGRYPYPLPPHPLSWASQLARKGFNKLGLKLTENSVAILSRAYSGRPNCNYCNGCSYGCPRKDKGSVDVTFIPAAEKTGNLTLVENACVHRIELDADHRVKGVLYYDGSFPGAGAGAEQFVAAPILILSCGAVETPRLLLNSNVANANGQVGKDFMETLLWSSAALHPQDLRSYRGIPFDSICWDFNDPAKNRDFAGGVRFSPSGMGFLGPLGYAKKVVGGVGDEHLDQMQRVFGRAVAIKSVGEFLPNKDTFIDIDPGVKDRFGIPVARIQAFLGDNEISLLKHMAKVSRQVLEAMGADELIEEFSAYDLFSATHVFGTCKMGDDSQTSVTDKNCRTHEISNLYIADGSVMPSSGGGEGPSLTIEALGLRLADIIADTMN